MNEFGQKVSAKSVLKVMRRMGLQMRDPQSEPVEEVKLVQGRSRRAVPNLLERDFGGPAVRQARQRRRLRLSARTPPSWRDTAIRLLHPRIGILHGTSQREMFAGASRGQNTQYKKLPFAELREADRLYMVHGGWVIPVNELDGKAFAVDMAEIAAINDAIILAVPMMMRSALGQSEITTSGVSRKDLNGVFSIS